ncbi:DNA-directed RNA polymerase subunit K [Methanohalophilus levihalophilus]|uniref:DNA-directed RNA polymerase subunit K n=1 Tax=Methanohalophilus levihalophilus TaxID=1431282 RepID=UPI001AE36200|nr:DNA-directed RNA polymerase subunit K [Methanohalophilus levihalophilus]MBP2031143.1 DNA-directed RNA polymerase subunit K [Methanohalophilus levihalophilus]
MSKQNYTRYERARIIGSRSLQISMEAPILLDVDSDDPLKIATLEYEEGVIPITVKRADSQ